MTPQEILNEIYKLPLTEQQELIEQLSENISNEQVAEIRLQEVLHSKGLIQNIKPPRTKKIGDFNAVSVKGRPVSETIIEERR